jgi:hypothetical protein
LTGDARQDERSVLQVEHIQTGASMRAVSFNEAEQWMFAACHTAQTDPDHNSQSNTETDIGSRSTL